MNILITDLLMLQYHNDEASKAFALGNKPLLIKHLKDQHEKLAVLVAGACKSLDSSHHD